MSSRISYAFFFVFLLLAGAWYGFEAIPEAWRRSLARVELPQKAADSLLKS